MWTDQKFVLNWENIIVKWWGGGPGVIAILSVKLSLFTQDTAIYMWGVWRINNSLKII